MLYDANQEVVYNVESKAGDLVIFMEATIHGALPWKADHERRSLLYRYCPKSMHTSGGIYQTSMPTWVDELTEAQQAAVEPRLICTTDLSLRTTELPLVQPGQETEPHRPRGQSRNELLSLHRKSLRILEENRLRQILQRIGEIILCKKRCQPLPLHFKLLGHELPYAL